MTPAGSIGNRPASRRRLKSDMKEGKINQGHIKSEKKTKGRLSYEKRGRISTGQTRAEGKNRSSACRIGGEPVKRGDRCNVDRLSLKNQQRKIKRYRFGTWGRESKGSTRAQLDSITLLFLGRKWREARLDSDDVGKVPGFSGKLALYLDLSIGEGKASLIPHLERESGNIQ